MTLKSTCSRNRKVTEDLDLPPLHEAISAARNGEDCKDVTAAPEITATEDRWQRFQRRCKKPLD
jgi:hypothetical protein